MKPSRGTADAAALSVRDLAVVAAGRDVLRRVSFEVAAGEVVAVLGPNGSGKTTLLEAIAGLRPEASGSVVAQGTPLRSFRERARRLAFMPEADVLPEEATLGTALGLAARDGLVETFGLGPLLDARATEVSRGEAKRAQLCAALRLGRPIALLDEPFAAFDPLQLRRLLPQFRAAVRGAGVLVTVHQMRTAELVADRLLLLCEGRAIACGTPEELRRRAGAESAALDEVFLRLLDQEEGRALP